LALQAIKSGVPAVPATLEFARFLSNNASTNSQILQDTCFKYSSQSSSSMDSFATVIQGLVKKVQGFIAMMMKYSTPAGIDRLEKTVQNFATHALADAMKIVEKTIGRLVNKSIPLIGDAVMKAAHGLGDKIGDALGNIVKQPVQGVLKGPLTNVMSKIIKDPKMSKTLSSKFSPIIADKLSNKTGTMIGNVLGNTIEKLAKIAISAAGNAANKSNDAIKNVLGGLALEQIDSESLRSGDGDMVFLDDIEPMAPNVTNGAFQKIITVLNALTNLLPTATKTLTLARREVIKVAGNLDSIFAVFEVKGPSIFDTVAFLYKLIWVLYFFFLAPLTLGLLYYAFWAGGYFGGPKPYESDVPDTADTEPYGCRQRIGACFNCCCSVWRKCHDSNLCFWSCIIFMQILVLVIFIVSLVLCILAGVKAFIVAGCAQVYMLSDNTICFGTLSLLKQFLQTFKIGGVEADPTACQQHSLLTCEMIVTKMQTSTILTTIFSFLGAIMSFQLLIESGCLHERAKYRRMARTIDLQKDAGTLGSSG